MFFNKTTVKNRSLIMQKIRDFFTQNDFLEVETPILTPIPGMEPYLTPFETMFTHPLSTPHHSIPLYLNTSPELQMKKLLGSCLPDGSSAGFNKIFNITKVFRNGEMNGPLHNPEFTMLEWYRKNADYKDLMNDCESLILELVEFGKSAQSMPCAYPINSPSLTYQSQIIDLSTPWPRFTTNELFIKYCGIDLLENKDFTTFKKTIDDKAAQTQTISPLTNFNSHSSIRPSVFSFSSAGCHTWDDLYFKIFLNHIEPELARLNTPIFIYDYPVSQAALAKTSFENPFFAERFELYIKGIELANAFSELTDSKEQRARLIEEQNLRKQLGKTVFPIDEEFLQALDQITACTADAKAPCRRESPADAKVQAKADVDWGNRPPCRAGCAAGIALGLDRLLMLLLDKKSIEEVLLFPAIF